MTATESQERNEVTASLASTVRVVADAFGLGVLVANGDGEAFIDRMTAIASEVRELRIEKERRDGDLAVAVREAAQCRQALKLARALVKLDHSTAGIETLRLVDAALDKRLTPEEAK